MFQHKPAKPIIPDEAIAIVIVIHGSVFSGDTTNRLLI
jgi:hypothetical protein